MSNENRFQILRDIYASFSSRTPYIVPEKFAGNILRYLSQNKNKRHNLTWKRERK